MRVWANQTASVRSPAPIDAEPSLADPVRASRWINAGQIPGFDDWHCQLHRRLGGCRWHQGEHTPGDDYARPDQHVRFLAYLIVTWLEPGKSTRLSICRNFSRLNELEQTRTQALATAVRPIGRPAGHRAGEPALASACERCPQATRASHPAGDIGDNSERLHPGECPGPQTQVQCLLAPFAAPAAAGQYRLAVREVSDTLARSWGVGPLRRSARTPNDRI